MVRRHCDEGSQSHFIGLALEKCKALSEDRDAVSGSVPRFGSPGKKVEIKKHDTKQQKPDRGGQPPVCKKTGKRLQDKEPLGKIPKNRGQSNNG